MTNEVEVYMKRTTKIFVAIALLLAGTVFAQSNPEEITLIGYKCEGGNKNNSLECSIAQYGNITRFIKAGYPTRSMTGRPPRTLPSPPPPPTGPRTRTPPRSTRFGSSITTTT